MKAGDVLSYECVVVQPSTQCVCTHIASNAILPRQLWLSILAWLVFEFGLSFAVVPVYQDLYGIAK